MTDVADEPSSLLDWATELASDPAVRSRFEHEPQVVLDEQGLGDVPPADLAHSLAQVTDSVAARLGTEVDTAALTGVATPLEGESTVATLTRQFEAATGAVLAAGGPEAAVDPVAGELAGPVDGSLTVHDGERPAQHDTHDHDTQDHDLDGFDDAAAPAATDPTRPLTTSTTEPATKETTTMTDPGTATPGLADNDLDGFDDPVQEPIEVRTPGTPQGQWELELEARSHGYPTAEAYVSDADLTGGLRDGTLAWEPDNGSAAYGQLQNYMDAAATQGVPVADYAAQHHFTQDEIDAAYAGGTDQSDGNAAAGGDTDLDGLGAADPSSVASGSTWTPQPEDPFLGWPDGTGGAPQPAGDVDLDGFGTSPSSGGDTSVPQGDDPFSDTLDSSGASAGGTDLHFGTVSDDGGAGGGAESFDSFGSSGDTAGTDELPDGSNPGDPDTAQDFPGGSDEVSVPEAGHDDASSHDSSGHTDLGADGSEAHDSGESFS